MMATESEYRAILEAIAKKYLKPFRLGRHFHPEGDHLQYVLDEMVKSALFVKVVQDRCDNLDLYKPLGEELQYGAHMNDVRYAFERSGVQEALDENQAAIFEDLSPAVIPAVDIELLRKSGFDEPEAELLLICLYARKHLISRDYRPSSILNNAETEIRNAAQELLKVDPDSKNDTVKKPRKWFNGIGKILAGGITGLGNLLLGIGSIPSAGPASTHVTIGSCALAIGAISQGIGDLRGE